MQGTWSLLSYAGYTDRVCERLVFGIRESGQQVNVGVYCLPWSWTKSKAERYAQEQYSGAPAAAPAAAPPAATAPTSAPRRTLIGTGTPLTATAFCKARLVGCAAITAVDNSAEFEVRVMTGNVRGGLGVAAVSYAPTPARALTATFTVPAGKVGAAAADVGAFLAEWAGFGVPGAALARCAALPEYGRAVLGTRGGAEVSCQNRPEETVFLVAGK